MSRLLALAVRNLRRNTRRSLLTAMSIVVGVAFVIFLDGFLNGFIRAVIAASVETHIAAIQVHSARFENANENPLASAMADDLAPRILEVAGVRAATPRLSFEALLNNGARAEVVRALGVAEATETSVCPKRSESLDGQRFRSRDGIFVGHELAAAFGLTRGTQATLSATTVFGNQNALDVEVGGEMHFSEPFVGKRAVLTTLGFAQQLLRMPKLATEYAVAVVDLEQAREVATALQAHLGARYRVDTWRERDETAAVFVDRLTAVLYLVSLVFLVLVLSGVANTMLMSVHERVREIGTMLALGMRRRQLLALFVYEAVALASLSACTGALVGELLVVSAQRTGFALVPPGQPPVLIFPFVSLANIAAVIAATMLGAMVAAAYPAWRASRLRPVEALQPSD